MDSHWLEGALGIRDVVLMNNDVEDARVSAPTHECGCVEKFT